MTGYHLGRRLGCAISARKRAVASLWRDEQGIGTLEIVLIAAVLIVIAFVFKDWIIQFLKDLMASFEGETDGLFEKP